MHSSTREKAIKNKTNSSLPNHTDQCKCSSLIDVLATKLELLSKALTDANTKNAAIWTKVDKELSSLNEYLALSTPGLLAAKKVIQLSDAAIKTATASLVDRRVRESRLIIWGSFSRKVTPTKQAQSLLGSVLSKPDHESLHAHWLRRKGSKRTLGLLVTLSSPSAVQKVLGRAVSVQKANPTIRRLSEDRPLDARKPGHSSSREEMRKKLPDGAISADPKLKAKPIVVIAPCAPESTPRQTTATPDSSFYSTTADPSNSTGNDALEEASLTWTERPKYVQLSALLSVTDVKGATVNSTPKLQPSWIRSDVRSQVVKPTGKPTTCADVDIGECCENRTSTEAVKLPISSSTPPKVASCLLEKRSQLFLKKLTTGDTEDELAFRKMRNRCKSEIRQWNIRKQATILDLARKNRNVLFKYMRHRRRNKPSAFSLRDRNGEPTSDPIVVSEFYRDHYAGDSANSFVMHGEKGPEDITRIDAKKDLGIWLSPNLSFSLHLEKSAQKAFAVLRMIRRTFSRITRTDFQILYGAYVRPLLEYANPVVYSGRTKDVILIERVQRAATKMVAGLKSMDYETRLVVLDLFPLEYRRLRGDLILTYALFEQGLANRFFTVDPANTRRGHGERQLLSDKNKTDPGNLGKSLAPVYQSVNPIVPRLVIPMSSTQFEWPWQYNFPPFFTLQPNIETRRKQLEAWCQLVVAYFKQRNVFTVSVASLRDPTCPLFHNKQLERSANSELITSVLEELHKHGNLEWIDKSHTNARIIWRTPEEWASLISSWARASGHGNSVCTLFELTDGEDTEHEPFHGLDRTVLIQALQCLEKRGEAALMGEEGVKFLCV
ncbi:ESCRT-II complex subunit VPS25 [Clonorchis sinensis]|uniref:Vacuolar protein-sorting-associated protein 25 n=1 Tax=Clonorchis sinensis TaxID=79923 RepID=G7YNR9_CLOSI|nr:ESCRT-II complex subunit VPS25 [Clonorchis sinensis]